MKKLYIAVAVLIAVALTESCVKLRMYGQSNAISQQPKANINP